MLYSIFRTNVLVTEVKPLDSSELSQKKQSEDFIRLNFILNIFVDIQIGDYIFFEKTGQLYFLNKKPRVIESPKKYKYDCIFEGGIHELKKTKVFFQTPKPIGFYQDYKFPLTGNAETFLSFLVDNLNRHGSGYTVGAFKITDTQTIQFNNWNVFDSIVQLADKLGFNWYLEGKVLNFDSKDFNKAVTVQVGRKLGFIELTRTRVESENLETVVYGYGSTENMPPRTAEAGQTYDSELLTENRLAFDGVDGESKLENNIDKYGSRESIQEFDAIKPERIGTITGIDVGNVQIIVDDTIDFDIEQQKLPGIKPKINFLTGQLIGLNFDILYEDSTKTITMDFFSDESGQYPNDIIKAAIGDQYILFDLVMPDSYITDASARLEAATQEYLDRQSEGLELYEGKFDEEFIDSLNLSLDLGDLIRIVSAPFELDALFEIKELLQNITHPNQYAIKFGDIIPKSLLAVFRITNFTTQQQIYNVQRTTLNSTEITNQTTNILGQDLAWQDL